MQTTTELTSDGIILSHYSGDQTGTSVLEAQEQLKPLLEKLKSEGKPILILIDMTRIGKQDSSARMAAKQTLQTLQFHKMAAFGASVYLKYITFFILKPLGLSEKFQFFSTQEEAVAWLKQ